MEFKKWIDIFVHPKETIKKEKGKTSWKDAFVRVVIVGIVYGLIMGFFTFLFSLMGGASGAVAGIIAWILQMILWPIYIVVGWIVLAILLFITAKLLGGKADFTQTATDLTLYIAPVTFISALVAWIPLIGIFLVSLVGLWGLYILTIQIKETHNLTTGRAIWVWLIWAILWAIFVIAVAGVAMMAILAGASSAI